MKTEWGQFTEADYDFSDVIAKSSKNALNACCWYEYARESAEARNEIAIRRKKLRQIHVKRKRLSFVSPVRNFVLHEVILKNLSACPGFPDTPWQRLSDEAKLPVLRMVDAAPAFLRFLETADNPPLLFSRNEHVTTSLDDWIRSSRKGRPPLLGSEPIIFGFFRLNLKYSHPVLIERFTEYLRAFEGKTWVAPAEGKPARSKAIGRQSIPDLLSALAAMRLRYYCRTFAEANEKLEKTDRMSLYKRRDSFNRACNHALDHFQKFFGELDLSKPIHYTEGWAENTQK